VDGQLGRAVPGGSRHDVVGRGRLRRRWCQGVRGCREARGPVGQRGCGPGSAVAPGPAFGRWHRFGSVPSSPEVAPRARSGMRPSSWSTGPRTHRTADHSGVRADAENLRQMRRQDKRKSRLWSHVPSVRPLSVFRRPGTAPRATRVPFTAVSPRSPGRDVPRVTCPTPVAGRPSALPDPNRKGAFSRRRQNGHHTTRSRRMVSA